MRLLPQPFTGGTCFENSVLRHRGDSAAVAAQRWTNLNRPDGQLASYRVTITQLELHFELYWKPQKEQSKREKVCVV